MPTRNGKIAHLPNNLREQLNLRLLEGETARELAAWLNALPEVQSILESQFHASPISEVNLTHWRQGGYLQWFTERECFDSARALADGDSSIASAGLSAERLLNVLTLRFGELLTRWDYSPDDSISEAVAFSNMARKARILQGISRSLLAIHRIQSNLARKSEPSTSSASSHGGLAQESKQYPAASGCFVEEKKEKTSAHSLDFAKVPKATPSEIRNRQSQIPKILSGMINLVKNPSSPAGVPFQIDSDLSEILEAV